MTFKSILSDNILLNYFLSDRALDEYKMQHKVKILVYMCIYRVYMNIYIYSF